jgi:uncharacterized membrane protein YkvA (DUF1232 family)
VVEEYAANQVRFGAQTPFVPSGLLHLVTAHDLQALRSALAKGSLPPDFEAKLTRLHEGDLLRRYVEQNSRLCFALVLAALEGSFNEATSADCEHLVRVLAYVRKDDDAIPDYLSGGFVDDQQVVRAAAMELGPLLQAFKVWRLRHQVPGMWRGQ